ncbi:MAG: hypothetical protein QXT45_02695 [Candidatus Bilamarchaeaceae archaeon]
MELKINWKDLAISVILFWISFIIILVITFAIFSPPFYDASKVVTLVMLVSYSITMIYYFDRYPKCWSFPKVNLFISFLMGVAVGLPLFLLTFIANPMNILNDGVRIYAPFIIAAVGWGPALALMRHGAITISRGLGKTKGKPKKF